MHSRLRKPRKSFDNYGSAIEKQLNDDFQVYEYLNLNNIQGDNIDDYIKLFNTLLVQKNKKKKTLESLQVNYQQMASDNAEQSLQSSKIQTWGGAKQIFIKEYEEIQIQTSNQFQVKNNLWKQIVQTKKSLNLLKGDIGHLVSRNQAGKLLQSKMNKAKIVADDQYKRVSMAFIKDKQQIKLRSEMQKKFNKKLNNVSMYQDTTLVKCKRNYLDSMIKKKQIFDRLNYIEKVSSSINQSGDLERQKNLKNFRTLELFQFLLKISKLIQQVPKVEKDLKYTAESIHEFSYWLKNQQNYTVKLPQLPFDSSAVIKSTRKMKINSSYAPCLNSQNLQVITQEALNNALSVILTQYQRLSQSIDSSICVYNEHMKKSQDFMAKIQKYQAQEQQMMLTFSIDIFQEYQISKEERFAYQEKLKKFISFLKVIFRLLEYLQKNINYSSSHYSLQMRKTPSDQSQNERSFMDLNSRIIMTQQNLKESRSILLTQNFISNNYQKNYISQLHKNYYTLLFNDSDSSNHTLNQISQFMYDDLKSDLKCWFNLLKQYFIQGKNIKYPVLAKKEENIHKKVRLRKQSSSIMMRNNSLLQSKAEKKGQTEQEEIQMQEKFNDQTYKRCHTAHRQDGSCSAASFSNTSSACSKNKFRANNISLHRKSAHTHSPSTLINVNKLKNQSTTYKKAQRIQLLEDIDQDYYKMLKSTIRMQKQNTRKNYQFLRTFKRTKYSSRDQILQQKRFQSGYSMLFSNKRADDCGNVQCKTKTKKSGFYKAQQYREQKMKNGLSKSANEGKSFYSSYFLKSSNSNLDQMKENTIKKDENKQKNFQKKQSRKQKLSIKLKDVLNIV